MSQLMQNHWAKTLTEWGWVISIKKELCYAAEHLKTDIQLASSAHYERLAKFATSAF